MHMQPEAQKMPERRRRKALLIGFGVIVVFVVSLILLGRDRGPRYQGRSVNSWLKEAARTQKFDDRKFVEACEHMGAEAIPVELEMFNGTSVKLSTWYFRCYQKCPKWIQRWVPTAVHPQDLQEAARVAIWFNPHGHKYMEEIIQLFAATNAQHRIFAASVMQREQFAGDTRCVPELLRAATGKSPQTLPYDGRFRPLAAASVPILLQCLSNSPSIGVRFQANVISASMGVANPFARHDTPPWTRLYAARSLIVMNTNNIPLVAGVIKEAMNYPNPTVRTSAAVTYLNWCEPTSNRALDVLFDLAAGRSKSGDPKEWVTRQWPLDHAEFLLTEYFTRRTNLLGLLEDRIKNDPDPEFRQVSRKILEKVRRPN
jgi:hypothetical protein